VLRHLVTTVDKAITEPSPMARAEEEGEGGERRRDRESMDDDSADRG